LSKAYTVLLESTRGASPESLNIGRFHFRWLVPAGQGATEYDEITEKGQMGETRGFARAIAFELCLTT
jgi:hypothetical protein